MNSAERRGGPLVVVLTLTVESIFLVPYLKMSQISRDFNYGPEIISIYICIVHMTQYTKCYRNGVNPECQRISPFVTSQHVWCKMSMFSESLQFTKRVSLCPVIYTRKPVTVVCSTSFLHPVFQLYPWFRDWKGLYQN